MSKENSIEIIQQLSMTYSIFFCAKMMIVLFQNRYMNKQDNKWESLPEVDKQFKLLQFLFIDSTEEKLPYLQDEIIEPLKRGEKILFFQAQIIELVRLLILHGSDKPDDGKSFQSSELRTAFFKALLYASESWYNFFGEDLNNLPNNNSKKSDENIFSLLRFCRFDKFALDGGQGMLSEYTIERGAYFYNYLLTNLPKEDLQYENFEQQFKNKTGLELSKYHEVLALLATQQFVISNPKDILYNHQDIFNPEQLLANCPNYKNRFNDFDRYISFLSQNKEELKENAKDLRTFLLSLRNRPIFKTDDGRHTILAPVFFIEKATAGPLFEVVKSDKKNAINIFSLFGKIFEKYIREILNRISNQEAKKHSFIFDDPNKNPERLDAILDYGDTICFVEMKSIWIKDEAVYRSKEHYLTELKTRYCNNTDGGIYQLANKINKYITGIWGNGIYNAKTIYPVLIIHNRFDDAIRHSYFFNKQFLSLLANNGINGYTIKPLITINVDILESLEAREPFINLIKDYDIERSDRDLSFSDFVAYKGFSRINSFLEQKVIERLDYFRKHPT